MHSHVDATDVSRHKCLIYDGDLREQLPVVVPLLASGLKDNWRCLYLGSPDAVDMIDTALSSEGIDTSAEVSRGALVLTSDRSHLKGGRFDPDSMIDGLDSSVDEAVRSGFRGLCATGDMRWELGADENFDRLLEYEARLEELIAVKPLRGICQYHRELLPARAVREALVTHRAAYVGRALNHDNLFYVPPKVLLASRGDGKELGEWMCQQIVRVLDAEQTRDEVLRNLERRVDERTAELALANNHLKAFSYSVSHDLRAPLRAISGFASILKEDAVDRLLEEDRGHLDGILEGAHRMRELIDGMLVLGRAVEANMRRGPVDLTALATEVWREVAAAEPGRTVDMRVQPGLLALGDPTLLRAVLTNLVGNAWKFTARRAAARIEVGQAIVDGQRVFYVRDNGAGFDMQYADKLFGVFQRLHGDDEFPGTGVGLATVERIIGRHGGRVWATSQPDEGATFFFTLPERPSDAD